MPSTDLRRTIRRCTAVLLIPLSMTPWVFIARLKTDGYPYLNLILSTGDYIAMIMAFGAVTYLVGSLWLQLKDGEEAEVADTTQTE